MHTHRPIILTDHIPLNLVILSVWFNMMLHRMYDVQYELFITNWIIYRTLYCKLDLSSNRSLTPTLLDFWRKVYKYMLKLSLWGAGTKSGIASLISIFLTHTLLRKCHNCNINTTESQCTVTPPHFCVASRQGKILLTILTSWYLTNILLHWINGSVSKWILNDYWQHDTSPSFNTSLSVNQTLPESEVFSAICSCALQPLRLWSDDVCHVQEADNWSSCCHWSGALLPTCLPALCFIVRQPSPKLRLKLTCASDQMACQSLACVCLKVVKVCWSDSISVMSFFLLSCPRSLAVRALSSCTFSQKWWNKHVKY